MRDPRRIDDVLLAIGEVWALDPDLRLGQLLYVALRPDEPCPELSGIEDRDLVRRVQALGERLRARGHAEPGAAPDRRGTSGFRDVQAPAPRRPVSWIVRPTPQPSRAVWSPTRRSHCGSSFRVVVAPGRGRVLDLRLGCTAGYRDAGDTLCVSRV